MVRRKNVYSVLHFILNCNTQCVHAQSTVILYFTVEKKAKVCFKEKRFFFWIYFMQLNFSIQINAVT